MNAKVLVGLALLAVLLAGYLLISKTSNEKEPPLLDFSIGNSLFGGTYYVTIYPDGTINYRETKNLEEEVAEFNRTLTPAQMESIRTLIRKENLFEQQNATGANIADAGSYQVSITLDGKQHTISCALPSRYQCPGVYRLHLLLNQLLGVNMG